MKKKAYLLLSCLIILWCIFIIIIVTDSRPADNVFDDAPIITDELAETPIETNAIASKPPIVEPAPEATCEPEISQEPEITVEPEQTPEPEIIPEPVIPEIISVTGEDRMTIAIMAAKAIYGESRGVFSLTEQACVVWTILNRVDNWNKSIAAVITAPNQFCYDEAFPLVDDYGRDLVDLALDVISRWEREHAGEVNVGRVLPIEYMWYGGANDHNWFRDGYQKFDNIWDYSLPSPYET